MEQKVVSPFVARVFDELDSLYDFRFMREMDDVEFKTDQGKYGIVGWRPDSENLPLFWSSHEYWHVADESGDDSSHVARLDLEIGVNFEDHNAAVMLILDFVEDPMDEGDVTSHVCTSIRSEEDWTRFKCEHLDPLLERAEELAEEMCGDWSEGDTDDSSACDVDESI